MGGDYFIVTHGRSRMTIRGTGAKTGGTYNVDNISGFYEVHLYCCTGRTPSTSELKTANNYIMYVNWTYCLEAGFTYDCSAITRRMSVAVSVMYSNLLQFLNTWIVPVHYWSNHHAVHVCWKPPCVECFALL